jgi:hypothetical protein
MNEIYIPLYNIEFVFTAKLHKNKKVVEIMKNLVNKYISEN